MAPIVYILAILMCVGMVSITALIGVSIKKREKSLEGLESLVNALAEEKASTENHTTPTSAQESKLELDEQIQAELDKFPVIAELSNEEINDIVEDLEPKTPRERRQMVRLFKITRFFETGFFGWLNRKLMARA